MSERGSFVTEYIHCSRCLAAAREVFCSHRSKYLCAWEVPAWEGGSSPIIAGKISGIYNGEEVHQIKCLAVEMGLNLCHVVRIAVIAESGTAFVIASPDGVSVRPVTENIALLPLTEKAEADIYARGYRAGSLAVLNRIRNTIGTEILQAQNQGGGLMPGDAT